jgi:DNA-directed RNA polymerase specialized sigma24 family protein
MNWQELSDRKLVELCLEGNKDAIAELLRRYKRMVARVVARTLNAANLKPTSVVEDLMQEAWARVTVDDMRPLRELQWLHDGALRGLLQIAAATATQDYIRKIFSEKRDIRKEESLTEIGAFLPASGNIVANVEYKILVDQLIKCLQGLIHDETDCIRDLAIFQLFYRYRITAADLARVYRMNVRKVENTLARLGRLAKAHCL